MFIINPLRPGSVTTDILHDGAVTCVKTDFTACNLSLSDVSLSGTITGGTLKPGTPLAVAYGGTGSSISTYTWDGYGNIKAVAGLSSGSNIAIYDTNSNAVITCILGGSRLTTIYNLTLNTPLPIASGGTGLTAPSLVAGTNISLSGSWPNQTIAVITSPVFTGEIYTNAGMTVQADSYPHIQFDNASGTLHWKIQDTTSTGVQGALWIINEVSSTISLQITTDDTLIITKIISNYNGVTTVGVGIPSLVAQVDTTGLSANVSTTTLFTPSSAGFYKVRGFVVLHESSGSSDAASISINYTTSGTSFSAFAASLPSGTYSGVAVADGEVGFYCDASVAIQYYTTVTLGSGDTYDIHLRLERI